MAESLERPVYLVGGRNEKQRTEANIERTDLRSARLLDEYDGSRGWVTLAPFGGRLPPVATFTCIGLIAGGARACGLRGRRRADIQT